LLEWIAFYYYSHSCQFNDPWTNDSPHFPLFVFFLFLFWKLNFFLTKRIMKFWTFFFEKCMFEWMNAWIFSEDALMNDFFECIYSACLKDFFSKKNVFVNAWFFLMHIWCMFEWILFFCEKMHLWNFGIFLFENTFINAWFCFWNACIIYVWMIFFNEKMHLQNFGLFLFENAFMNVWFFLDLLLFSFNMYACIILFFFENAYIHGIFGNAYIDISSWFCSFENTYMKIYFLFSFKFSIFLNSNALMDAWNCNF